MFGITTQRRERARLLKEATTARMHHSIAISDLEAQIQTCPQCADGLLDEIDTHERYYLELRSVQQFLQEMP